MSLHYIVRTFPLLSESFVQREIGELVRRGAPLTVWSLLPGDADPAVVLSDEVAAVVRPLPGPRGLIAATVAVAASRPRPFVRTLAWCARWAWRERDGRHLAALPYAAHLARRIGPGAHLHAHFANAPTTVALAAGMLGGQPVSFTGHAKDLFAVTSPAFLAEKVARSRFAAVETDYARHRVRAIVAPRDADRVVTVRNGLGPAPPVVRAPQDGVVVTVARLVPKKGIATLLAAVSRLRDRGIDVRAEILGGGPQADALHALARELGVADRVRFAGPRPRPEVDAALARAQLFVLACRREADGDEDNLPVALLEAMQLGIPVVTTPVAGIGEAVIDGHSGLLVDPDDPDGLADALARLLDDAELREWLAAGARRIVTERFGLERNVDELVRRFGGQSPPA